MRGGEMRGSVTPTASKLEGGDKRAHKTVFFDIGRVCVRGQVCVCVTFNWLINRLHFDTSSFDKNKNVCSVCSRIFVYVLMRKRTFDWLGGFKLSSFDCFTFSRACTFY